MGTTTTTNRKQETSKLKDQYEAGKNSMLRESLTEPVNIAGTE
jgi:hypothetical protein